MNRNLLLLLLIAPVPCCAQRKSRDYHPRRFRREPASNSLNFATRVRPIASIVRSFACARCWGANKATTGPGTRLPPITRSEAERLAIKNNPRITANHLLALAARPGYARDQVWGLPQIYGAITAEKAEDGSRISSGGLTDSRLYTHAGTGGTLTAANY